ncbi:glycosyltransferase family 39 protein [Candidatus Micrarchaeota archaeon]|nr:glycosyltransferase family 39 protein [Candidatus Micrarchaeota archaeon]
MESRALKDVFADKRVLLLLVLLAAFLARVFYAANAEFGADEVNYFARAINFFSLPHLSTIDHPSLYFYLIDSSYKLFGGVNWLSARFPGVLLGTLSVLLIYLIGEKLFTPRVGLASAFFSAFSFFQAKYSGMGTIDTFSAFFALLCIYFFSRRKENSSFLAASGLALGLAAMSKYSALFILPALIAWALLEERKMFFERKALLGVFFILLFLSPAAIYNFLLFEKEGILDFQFTRLFKTSNEKFQNLAGINEGFEFGKLPGGIASVSVLFASFFPIISLLALAGIFFKQHDANLRFLAACFLFPSFFFAGIGFQSFYFQLAVPFLFLIAGVGLNEIADSSLKQKNSTTRALLLVLIIFACVELLLASNDFAGLEKSATLQLRDYARNIPENALVVADHRIYLGRMAWALHDKHYISVVDDKYLAMALDYPGTPEPIRIFFVECTKKECGWRKGLLNDSIAQRKIMSIFESAAISQHVIFEDGKPAYTVKDLGTFMFKPNILVAADATHWNYFYPVGWRNEDDFYIRDCIDCFKDLQPERKALQDFGMLIVYAGIASAFASIFYLLVKIVKFFV